MFVARRSWLLVLSLVLTLSLSITLTAQDGNILLYGGNQDIDNIDPAIGENYSINAALRSLYDALFIARGNEIVPNLVESYEINDDATVFTFKLVETATFNDDGSPVNAEAVAYSFNRAMELQGPPTYRWEGIVDSVAVVDEYTVEFTLTQSFAPFIGTLTQLYVINPATVEANLGDDFGQTYLKENAAGSGPFVQGRWEIGNLYEFTAVGDYWGQRAGDNRIDGFIWIIQREGSTQVNSLLSGETHVADTIDFSDIDRINETDGFHVEQHPGYLIDTLKFNNQQGPMSDVNVRKAVASAMDYASLPQVLDNMIWVLEGPQPDNIPGFIAGLPIPTFDLDAAREYLAASDYADEWEAGTLALDYVYVTDFAMEEIPGLILQANLAEIGVTLNMTPMLWPDMVASCNTVETGPDIINIYTVPAYADQDAHYYNQYHSSSWGSFNSCNFYSNARVDELLDAARSEGDAAAREAMYAEVQEILVEDTPAAWMYNEAGTIAFNDCVGGFTFSPMYPLTVLFQDLTMESCP
ncbi:MAG: ABC transporter substrate-binding protein [Anaerolineae bacterium]|nr:ABC transporter substrate-binding protein [Anaerolineae bacterium]MCA9895458.1 ABC transporter substrate-binding protein [Anaerolineae bacterium]MCB9461054.1 ABC transporter substrate-binding protein [Anaerolineaceae bacterium]